MASSQLTPTSSPTLSITVSLGDQLMGLPDWEPTPGSPATKYEANYRPSDKQNSPTVRCGNCIHFENSKCDIVTGVIGKYDVCDYFRPNPDRPVTKEPSDGG